MLSITPMLWLYLLNNQSTRKREDWNQMMEEWLDDPEAAANHMAFGMGLDQRRQSNQLSGKKTVHTWV